MPGGPKRQQARVTGGPAAEGPTFGPEGQAGNQVLQGIGRVARLRITIPWIPGKSGRNPQGPHSVTIQSTIYACGLQPAFAAATRTRSLLSKWPNQPTSTWCQACEAA